jgi:glycerol-3-phosphate dehydrogenase subunit C
MTASPSGEGGLAAPTRKPYDWHSADFYDRDKIDTELRRVFDICHGCRRCFNLCDSFPRLFDLIDESKTGELDSVDSGEFAPVIDACTLCDMCFMTKCPYVPPHDFDLDFPHLMVRARAVDHKDNKTGFVQKQLSCTDRNGRLAAPISGLVNWGSKQGNALTRPAMEAVAGIDKRAHLPKFNRKTFVQQAANTPAEVNTTAPAHGRKAVLYATCFANYNSPEIGAAARAVLAHNGVETEVVYPGCCGMPQLEHGDIAAVAESAAQVAAELKPWIDKGYDVISLVASCSLMLKFEWPLIVPDNADVAALSAATFDIDQYLMDIADDQGLAEGLSPLEGGITVHIACHARAQNIGQKAAQLLRQIPDTEIDVIERCSGHGGSWGVMKENFDVALKVGKPVARAAVKSGKTYVASECPLAADHILQGMAIENQDVEHPASPHHPIELIALSYGLGPKAV